MSEIVGSRRPTRRELETGPVIQCCSHPGRLTGTSHNRSASNANLFYKPPVWGLSGAPSPHRRPRRTGTGHVRHLQRHRVIGIATLTRTAARVLDDKVHRAAGWISYLILVCALVADRDRVERRLEHLLLLLHLYLSRAKVAHAETRTWNAARFLRGSRPSSGTATSVAAS